MKQPMLVLVLVATVQTAFAQSQESGQTKPTDQIKIEESITVEGTAPRDGYRVESTTTLGAQGATRLLDTPYTVNIVPAELLTNGQVKNLKEASKYLPLVQFQEMQGSEILRPATRGMQGSNMQNARMDGMGIVVTGANSMESLQQIEVLNGLGAAMYGPANPSGMFN